MIRSTGFTRSLLSRVKTNFQFINFPNVDPIRRVDIPTPIGLNFASVGSSEQPQGLDDDEYYRKSEETFEEIIEMILAKEDSFIDLDNDFDLIISNGVIRICLGSRGEYVINKQSAVKQIWLVSPKSGPYKFSYDPDRGLWVTSRSVELMSLLKEELSEILNEFFD